MIRAARTGEYPAGWWLGLLSVATLACVTGDVVAAWKPSPELAFTVRVVPDSATVGDPLTVLLEGSAPEAGDLILPAWSDTLGSFHVLEVEEDTSERLDGRRTFRKALRVTAYETGTLALPDLPLLWVPEPGDTAVAYAPDAEVQVRNLLPEEFDVSDPQAALAQLRDLKDVVPVAERPWWQWALLGAAAAALLAMALLLWRRRSRAEVSAPAQPRARPALSPDRAFEQGLRALFERELLERGEVKQFYVELSLLLRTYAEARYEIPAIEATRSEILRRVEYDSRFDDRDREWLGRWLAEGDLVKFARVEKLLEESMRYAEEAREWVRATTRREAKRREARERDATGTVVTAGVRAATGSDASSRVTAMRPVAPGGPERTVTPEPDASRAAPPEPTVSPSLDSTLSSGLTPVPLPERDKPAIPLPPKEPEERKNGGPRE